MFWYLVSILTGQFVGPLPEEPCRQAAFVLHAQGVVCRMPTYEQYCDVPGRPDVRTICPVFEFPKVTVRP